MPRLSTIDLSLPFTDIKGLARARIATSLSFSTSSGGPSLVTQSNPLQRTALPHQYVTNMLFLGRIERRSFLSNSRASLQTTKSSLQDIFPFCFHGLFCNTILDFLLARSIPPTCRYVRLALVSLHWFYNYSPFRTSFSYMCKSSLKVRIKRVASKWNTLFCSSYGSVRA